MRGLEVHPRGLRFAKAADFYDARRLYLVAADSVLETGRQVPVTLHLMTL